MSRRSKGDGKAPTDPSPIDPSDVDVSDVDEVEFEPFGAESADSGISFSTPGMTFSNPHE